MATTSRLSPQNIPSKPLKTLTESPNRYSESFFSKGKSKIEESASSLYQIESDTQTTVDCCGICLSTVVNGVGAIRGYIDSCDHHFCFVCIMEWSKVESKCPLCKRRFSTIRRPPKAPHFESERIVHVPIRDQVYYHYGNATVGPPDPYLEVKCSVCDNAVDENLTLLCDLCDSAAHTYCVGLGVAVPEGDWFCQDCTILRDEHDKIESFSDVEISSGTIGNLSSAKEHFISYIVQEPCEDAVQRTRGPSGNRFCLPCSTTDMDNNSLSSSRQQDNTEFKSKSNARTLGLCRSVHCRIRMLRENWKHLQSGMLHFSAVQNGGSISTQNPVSCLSDQQLVSCLNQQSTAKCLSSNVREEREPYEILKAWKMMDKARSTKQVHERSNNVHPTGKCLRRKFDSHIKADDVKYEHISPVNTSNVGNGKLGHHYSYVYGKQKRRRPLGQTAGNHSESSGKGYPLRNLELASCLSPRIQQDPHNEIASRERQVAKKVGAPARLISSFAPERMVSDAVHAEKIDDKSCCLREEKHPNEKKKSEKICGGSKQYSDAKIEIQSLVKLYLKHQLKNHKLGIDAFKEVAWLSTHSILAACGLKDSRPSSSFFQGPICSHAYEDWQPQMSSLMPKSCRECFYVFVKDVVNYIVLQKKRRQVKSNF